MATLVLSTVGGLAGGPVGAAIGGLLGNAIDRRVLDGGRREGPRLSDLSVQLSSYGAVIARVHGAMRIAGCVIWARDIAETRGTFRAGKGQPATTTYSYSASFAVALSSRPILRVGRIWAEGKLLRGAAGDWKSATGFRLHTGGEDQPVDPLIASAEGALAPAHRGIAYAVFENLALADFGNRIPSLTFEVIADEGAVTVTQIARDCGAVGGSATATLDGFAASGDAGRVLSILADGANGWLAPVAGGVALRDDAPAILLQDVAARAVGERPGHARSIAPVDTVPKSLSLAHHDPARDWQIGVQRATRPGAGRGTERIDLPAAMSATAAKTRAATRLATMEAGRRRRIVRASVSAVGIAPGSVVMLAGEEGRWRVEEVALEHMVTTLTLVAMGEPVSGQGASGGRPVHAPDLAAGRTVIHAFELPASDASASGVRLHVAAAGEGPGWRQAALLWRRADEVGWTEAGATAAPATIGTIAVSLPPGLAAIEDRHNTLVIDLLHDGMSLESRDPGAIDGGANLALIGDEVIQFASAIPLGNARWRIERLWRGRLGSAPAGAAAGGRFVLLAPGTLARLDDTGPAGSDVVIAAAGVGDDAAPSEQRVAPTGRSCAPPSPVHLRIVAMAEGTMLRWTRRSRSGWHWRDGTDAPLGEEAERYRVTIAAQDGAARTIVTESPGIALSDEERAAGGTAQVRQIGTVADSAAAFMIFPGDAG